MIDIQSKWRWRGWHIIGQSSSFFLFTSVSFGAFNSLHRRRFFSARFIWKLPSGRGMRYHITQWFVLSLSVFFSLKQVTNQMKPSMRLVTESNLCMRENTENSEMPNVQSCTQMHTKTYELAPPSHSGWWRTTNYAARQRYTLMICDDTIIDDHVFFGKIFTTSTNNKKPIRWLHVTVMTMLMLCPSTQ